MIGPRFDFAPLRRYVTQQAGVSTYSLQQIARDLGVCESQPSKWQRRGLTTAAADRAAIRLGLHPSLLWPEWWETAALEPQPKETAA